MNKPKLDHLYRMTDMVGIAEHCLIATPDLREGYCVDDNARALQVALRLKEKKLADIYLKFLVSAAGEYGFKNDMNQNLVWENESIGENFGRAMGTLAEVGVKGMREDQRLTALFLFDQYTYSIDKAESYRAKAWLIYGLYMRLKVDKNLNEKVKKYYQVKLAQGKTRENTEYDSRKLIKKMADDMVKAYKKHNNNNWSWFENVITYDNGRLPWGLLWAYKVLGDEIYLRVAVESLDFLMKNVFDQERDCFSFAGYRGWITQEGVRVLYGQQPIEAGSTVEVCCLAHKITKEKKYLDWAKKALDWYYGRNILGAKMVDQNTGGVYDGLEEKGVNLNQGAESLLSYLLARFSFED